MFRIVIVCLIALCSASVLNADDYTFSCWLNGWRKNKIETSNDILGIETNAYGFTLDLDDFQKSGFSKWQSGLTYEAAVQQSVSSLKSLPAAKLLVELEVGKTKYVANACRAGLDDGDAPLSYANLLESGRHIQHYRFQELDFRSPNGEKLSCVADLGMVAWADSLTFNLSASPRRPYEDGIRAGVAGKGICVLDKPFVIEHKSEFDSPKMTLETWVKVPETLDNKRNSWIVCKNGHEHRNGNFGFRLHGSGAFAATMNIGGGRWNTTVLRTSSVRRDQWNHLVMTYDGKEMIFYVNGKKVDEKVVGKKRKPGDRPIIIGNNIATNLGGRTLKGVVDQVRIWNRTLDAKQIRQFHRNQGQLADKNGLVLNEDFESYAGDVSKKLSWGNAKVRLAFSTQAGVWEQKAEIEKWVSGDLKTTSLTCNFLADKTGFTPKLGLVANGQQHPVTYNTRKNCYYSNVAKLKRKWKAGYTDIRDYDEFEITVPKSSDAQPLPFLLHLSDVANITGVCPMLCYADGTPTGIPVQLSKNWHDEKVGSYLMAYTKLPQAQADQTYLLRLAYGFYGTLPSASHAQLSLVGYGSGNNGRWDQLAVGCFGETICFDMDMSCVDVSITDIRLLMARAGAQGKKWSWTDAGWGGDWLNIQGKRQTKLFQKEMKTAYLSHGPCLTDVLHSGFYGIRREVRFSTQVQTLRTDDYCRTFQNFRYDFASEVAAKEASIFKLGRTRDYYSPKIAYGNADGLIKELDVPDGLKEGEVVIDETNFSGDGPWWVAFPGGQTVETKRGTGYKALIIREFEAVVDGEKQAAPAFRATQYKSNDSKPNLDFELLAAVEKPAFKQGDFIKMDLELITLPSSAADYYGPNLAFQRHLQAEPLSWKTTYREVQGNDLDVTVKGGKLIRNYPILVQASGPEVIVDIRGGVGAVPISFSGLASATGHELYRQVDGKRQKFDQAVHGNDFWQTDYDPSTKTYKLTFNLPLDGIETSTWIFK